ncbi:MSMEG_0569 family flavin-dependent oxidoreductase [uncultured Amnibacterium sp.]|uniref:MSMEG_0569 family flavin-dependent oxidoreductase n=1 Tax=uncultured Amnibacterium sp. TaxID=1631851 RepID=UPI0035CAF5F6
MREVDVVVVGGGQAGMAVSWHLKREDIDHVVLERATPGHEWLDGRWDAFTLVTPNFQCRLPGFAYDGDQPDGFMTKDETHAFLQRYAASFEPPIEQGVEVTGLTRTAEGFRVRSSAGELDARAVVIATGGYHRPIVPAFAAQLPADVHQLHSSQYKNAEALPPGGVLVVGSGQSGAQIAEDLHLAGRPVHLALGRAPRSARFYRGRDCIAWLEQMGVYDIGVEQHASGLTKRESTNHYMTGRAGGHDIDLRLFASQGMQLSGRLVGADGAHLRFDATMERDLDHADSVMESIKNDIDAYIERAGIAAPTEDRYRPVWRPATEPTELDLHAAGITNIVWAIGYRADYSWVEVGVFDGRGHPTHQRGVTGVPGLYFLGLPWLYTWGSGRFAGIARDAEYLGERIAEQVGARAPAHAA